MHLISFIITIHLNIKDTCSGAPLLARYQLPSESMYVIAVRLSTGLKGIKCTSVILARAYIHMLCELLLTIQKIAEQNLPLVLNFLYLLWISKHVDDGCVNSILILQSCCPCCKQDNRVFIHVFVKNLQKVDLC